VIEPREDKNDAGADAIEKAEGCMETPDGRGALHPAAVGERGMCTHTGSPGTQEALPSPRDGPAGNRVMKPRTQAGGLPSSGSEE
jgi:hypothetical protein